MYAIIKTGGKQYRVEENSKIKVEKLKGYDPEDPVQFERVLLVKDGEDLQVGRPFLEDVAVKGEVTEQGKRDKIVVYKYKKRKGYRRKQGHRQPYTEVEISSIEQDGEG